MNIVNVGYDSTNYYILADTQPRLLIDVGWSGTLPKLRHCCKQKGIALANIPYFLITHYHPDHAALAEELKQTGCKLIVLETQIAAIPLLKTYMKPKDAYQDIDLTNAITVKLADSRVFLAGIGIHGEIISTPGHSDDSVTLVLDAGAAFVGDLPPPYIAADATAELVQQSWTKIRALGVTTVYAGHGSMYQLNSF